MQILTTDKLIKLVGMKSILRPGNRYVVSDQEAQMYLGIENQRRRTGRSDIYTDFRLSSFNPYERRYDGSDASGKNIAVYRHFAFGDSLIATAIPRYIKTLYPTCRIYYYCHPDMFDLNLGNQFIEHGLPIPIPINLDACVNFHDWHIFYEGMLENNSEPDQRNCYDDLFEFCGLRNVPPHFKRPFIHIRPTDYDAIKRWESDANVKLDLGEKYIIYQLSPANENRCYPVAYSREFWALFNANFSDYKVYVIGLDPNDRRKPIFNGLPKTVNMLNRSPSFRHLIPLIENAKLVVCPDSAIGHLAACFPHVPVISLWGPFSPDDRVKYYGNHYPLFHGKKACRWCPCHDHTFDIPAEKCIHGGRWHEIKDKYNDYCRTIGAVFDPDTLDMWCAALADITPLEILELADRLLKGERTPEHLSVEEDTDCQPGRLKDGEYEKADISEELMM